MSFLSCGKTPDVVNTDLFRLTVLVVGHSADSEAELTVGACGRGLLHRGVSEAESTETEVRLDFNSQRPPPVTHCFQPIRLYKLPKQPTSSGPDIEA